MLNKDTIAESNYYSNSNLSVSVREAEIIGLLFVAMRRLEERGYNLVQLEGMVSEAFAQLLPEHRFRQIGVAAHKSHRQH